MADPALKELDAIFKAPKFSFDSLIAPVHGSIGGGFDDDRNEGTRKHRATDYHAPAGSPIVAPADLEFIQGGVGGTNLRPNDRWAHYRIPGSDYEWRIAHQGELPEKGAKYKQGEPIGTVGNVIDNPHLHAGFYNTKTGQFEDATGKLGLKRDTKLEIGKPLKGYGTEARMSKVAASKPDPALQELETVFSGGEAVPKEAGPDPALQELEAIFAPAAPATPPNPRDLPLASLVLPAGEPPAQPQGPTILGKMPEKISQPNMVEAMAPPMEALQKGKTDLEGFVKQIKQEKDPQIRNQLISHYEELRGQHNEAVERFNAAVELRQDKAIGQQGRAVGENIKKLQPRGEPGRTPAEKGSVLAPINEALDPFTARLAEGTSPPDMSQPVAPGLYKDDQGRLVSGPQQKLTADEVGIRARALYGPREMIRGAAHTISSLLTLGLVPLYYPPAPPEGVEAARFLGQLAAFPAVFSGPLALGKGAVEGIVPTMKGTWQARTAASGLALGAMGAGEEAGRQINVGEQVNPDNLFKIGEKFATDSLIGMGLHYAGEAAPAWIAQQLGMGQAGAGKIQQSLRDFYYTKVKSPVGGLPAEIPEAEFQNWWKNLDAEGKSAALKASPGIREAVRVKVEMAAVREAAEKIGAVAGLPEAKPEVPTPIPGLRDIIDASFSEAQEAKHIRQFIAQGFYRLHPEMMGKLQPQEMWDHITAGDLEQMSEKAPAVKTAIDRIARNVMGAAEHSRQTEIAAAQEAEIQAAQKEAERLAKEAEKQAAAEQKAAEKAAEKAATEKKKATLKRAEKKAVAESKSAPGLTQPVESKAGLTQAEGKDTVKIEEYTPWQKRNMDSHDARERRLASLYQAQEEGYVFAQIGSRKMPIASAIKQVEGQSSVPEIKAARERVTSPPNAPEKAVEAVPEAHPASEWWNKMGLPGRNGAWHEYWGGPLTPHLLNKPFEKLTKARQAEVIEAYEGIKKPVEAPPAPQKAPVEGREITPEVEATRQRLAQARGVDPTKLEYIGDQDGVGPMFNIMDPQHPDYKSTVSAPKEGQIKAPSKPRTKGSNLARAIERNDLAPLVHASGGIDPATIKDYVSTPEERQKLGRTILKKGGFAPDVMFSELKGLYPDQFGHLEDEGDMVRYFLDGRYERNLDTGKFAQEQEEYYARLEEDAATEGYSPADVARAAAEDQALYQTERDLEAGAGSAEDLWAGFTLSPKAVPFTERTKRIRAIRADFPGAETDKVREVLRIFPTAENKDIALMAQEPELFAQMRDKQEALRQEQMKGKTGDAGAERLLPEVEKKGTLFKEKRYEDIEAKPPAGRDRQHDLQDGGALPAADERTAGRDLDSFASRMAEEHGRKGEGNPWKGVAYSSKMARSPEFQTLAREMRGMGIAAVHPTKGAPFAGSVSPDQGGHVMTLDEDRGNLTLAQVAGHELFHFHKAQGSAAALKLMSLVDTGSPVFEAYRDELNSNRTAMGLRPLGDNLVIEEISADFAADITLRQTSTGEPLNLAQAFKSPIGARLARARYLRERPATGGAAQVKESRFAFKDKPPEEMTIEERRAKIERAREALAGKKAAPTLRRAEPAQKVTGIRNTETAAERKAKGLSPVEVETKRTFGDAFDRGKALVDSGQLDPRFLAEQLAKTPRPLSAEESVALIYDRMRLQNEHGTGMARLEKAAAAGDKAAMLEERQRLARIEDDIDTNDFAARRTGYEQGLGLAARKMMIAQDYSLARIIQRLRVATGLKELPEALRAKVENLTKRLQEAMEKSAAHEERIAQLEAERKIRSIKRGVKITPEYQMRGEKRQALDADFKSLAAQLQDKLARLHISFDPAEVKLLAQMVKNRIQAGVLDAQVIIKDIYEELKDLPDVSERDIRDAISGYGRVPKASHEEITAQLREARRQMRLISALEDAKAGKAPAKSGHPVEPPSEKVRELERQLKQAMKEAGLDVAAPRAGAADPQAAALKAYKTRTTNRIAELEQMLATGNYEKSARRVLKMDPEAQNLKNQAEKLKERIDAEVHKQKLANRTKTERLLDWAVKWRRAVILSGSGTIVKLTTAATMRQITTPAEEMVGSILAFLPYTSKIMARAPREGGGLNVRAEAAAFRQWFEKQTRRDIVDVAKTGRGELDRLYGKKYDLPPEALDFFGHIHGALKVTPKRAEFFRSLQKRTEWAMRQGHDMSDPTTMATITAAAYIDANRAIFMQDNSIVTAYRMVINYLKHNAGTSGRTAATVAQMLMPIVKIPTNFIGETASYTAGGALALQKLIAAGGVKKLTPDQADYVARNLKKQGVGVVMLLLGMLGAASVGGYYQFGEKRKAGDVKAGGLRLFGMDVPHLMLHTPALEIMQIGATLTRVYQSYQEYNKSHPPDMSKGSGVPAALFAAVKGIMQQVPFFEEPVRMGQALKTSETAGKFGAQMAESLVTPPDVRRIAKAMDKAGEEQIPREQKTLGQTFQGSVPGQRSKLPLDTARFKNMSIDRMAEIIEKSPPGTIKGPDVAVVVKMFDSKLSRAYPDLKPEERTKYVKILTDLAKEIKEPPPLTPQEKTKIWQMKQRGKGFSILNNEGAQQ